MATILLTDHAVAKVSAYRALVRASCKVGAVYPHYLELPMNEVLKLISPERHSVDFTDVRWHGYRFEFSPSQAAVIRILWLSRDRGCPKMRQAALLEAASVNSQKLSTLFKVRDEESGKLVDHPCVGKMLYADKKGTFWLDAPPETDPLYVPPKGRLRSPKKKAV